MFFLDESFLSGILVSGFWNKVGVLRLWLCMWTAGSTVAPYMQNAEVGIVDMVLQAVKVIRTPMIQGKGERRSVILGRQVSFSGVSVSVAIGKLWIAR